LDAFVEGGQKEKSGPKRDVKALKAVKKRPSRSHNDDRLGIAMLKADQGRRETKGRKKASRKSSGKGASKMRNVLLFTLLLTMVGAYITYSGTLDLNKITGSLGSIKAPNISELTDFSKFKEYLKSENTNKTMPNGGKKAPVKPAKKPTPVVLKKAPPKRVSPTAPNKPTPKRRLIVVKRTPKSTPRIQKRKEPEKKPVFSAKRKEPEKKPVFSAKQASSYPYSIYLGSYNSLARAKKAIAGHRKKGLSPYWVKVDLGQKGTWFRIFTGYFESRKEAELYIKEKGIAEGVSKRTKYANLIGAYRSPAELDRKKVVLSKLGYFPYVIPGQNGESSLYTGVFYRKARAEEHRGELASKGIRGRIVER